MSYVKEITAEDVVEICNGKLICGNLDEVFSDFCKDTREIQKDDVYVAIKGETFDGNPIEFARQEIINTFEGNDNYGYEIITKSRFFNANDIHMFGSDHILTDEAVKWYK